MDFIDSLTPEEVSGIIIGLLFILALLIVVTIATILLLREKP